MESPPQMLNSGDYNRFSYLYTVCLKTIDNKTSGYIETFKIGV